MATVGLRTMRIWMIILTFINLVIVISHYAEQKYWDNWRNYYVYNITGTNSNDVVKREKFLLWQDWTLIVSSSVLFLAYIYAYKVITTRLHKYLRALLMVVPTVLVLFVGIQYVHLVLKLEFPTNHGPPAPFSCSYLNGLERAYCGVVEATYFFAILTGLFALLEIYLTTRNGPKQPKESHSYGSNGGYATDATMEIVGDPEHSMVHIQNPYANTHQEQILSPLQFSPFVISNQLILLPSPEQGKATLDSPEQHEHTPIILSTDPSNTPVQPSPLPQQQQQQQQQRPPEQIYDNRVPLPYSVQAQPYEKYIPRTQYQPPPRPPMPAQLYDDRMPLANPYSVQPMPVYQYQSKKLPQHPQPHLPEQAFDNRVPFPNPHSVQASAGQPTPYLPARAQIQQDYPYYRMPLPNPTPEQTAAGSPALYPPTRIQQDEYDQRPPANTSLAAAAPYPPRPVQQDEYDQRPPANTSLAAAAPYPPRPVQQDEYDQRPPANTSLAAAAPYPPRPVQQDEYDQRPPANTSLAAAAPYPPRPVQQDEYDQRPPANTSLAAAAPYPPRPVQQDEYDQRPPAMTTVQRPPAMTTVQRPPANATVAAVVPHSPTRIQQDEYDQRPPANTSFPGAALYPPRPVQQDEYDQRPPANTSFPGAAPYPPPRIPQDEYDQRPPANTSLAAGALYPPTLTHS